MKTLHPMTWYLNNLWTESLHFYANHEVLHRRAYVVLWLSKKRRLKIGEPVYFGGLSSVLYLTPLYKQWSELANEHAKRQKELQAGVVMKTLKRIALRVKSPAPVSYLSYHCYSSDALLALSIFVESPCPSWDIQCRTCRCRDSLAKMLNSLDFYRNKFGPSLKWEPFRQVRFLCTP